MYRLTQVLRLAIVRARPQKNPVPPNWVIAKLNEDLSAPQNSPYDEDPLKSLGIAKTLATIDWNKDGRGFLCLPSDRNIPLGVAAVMVRFYYKQMSDEDQKWCASYLLSGLEQPNIALASSIIKLGDLMQSMAPLVEDRPDFMADFKDWDNEHSSERLSYFVPQKIKLRHDFLKKHHYITAWQNNHFIVYIPPKKVTTKR